MTTTRKTPSDTPSVERTWALAEEAFSRGDKKGALFSFLALARQGEWLAYVEVGNLYEMGGNGVEKNHEEALFWYRKAVFEADDPNAHFALARLYFNGRELQQDYEKAFMHASKAISCKAPLQLADHYKPMAYAMLAFLYMKGLGTEKNINKAREVLVRGCDEGFVWSMLMLSSLELRRGRFLKWLKLRLKAGQLFAEISKKDLDDPRLIGVKRRLWLSLNKR